MKKLLTTLLVLLMFINPLLADYGDGCPVRILQGMKVFEDRNGNPIPHPGQWFTATYPGAVCGPSEVGTTWSAVRKDSPRKFTTDICFRASDYVLTQEAGLKRCDRANGKIFYIATPGVYDVTATCPGGVNGPGTWTLENVVVD
jgi:hypothetical protein